MTGDRQPHEIGGIGQEWLVGTKPDPEVGLSNAPCDCSGAAGTVEYVRVCDAYGTGYFFIPGSDTCLKIGGYIRTEVRFGRDISGTSDWSFFTRGQVSFSSKSDTEWGTLTGLITLRTNIDDETFLNEGYIDIAGLRVGMQYSWWDDDASGETDILATNDTRWNAIRYQYGSDNFDWFVAR
nr:porin [Rhizobium cauense]